MVKKRIGSSRTSFCWNKIEIKYVDIETYNEKLKKLIEKGCKETSPKPAVAVVFCWEKYSIIKAASFIELRFCSSGEISRIRVSLTGIKSENNTVSGHDGYEYIEEKFEKKQEDKGKKNPVSLFSAFSGRKYSEEYKNIKKCVPCQLDYINPHYKNYKLKECFKSDISSAYPAQLIKNLPTLHGCKKVEGFAEPSEEYPFAFYIKSRHTKIYNELDTRNFSKNKFYRRIYIDMGKKWHPNDDIENKKEITILCKKSNFSLKEIFEEVYEERKTLPEIKAYMNVCIGYFHRNNNPTLSHIAAVVLARCAFEMMERAKRIEAEGNTVLLINTDSIIWKGKQSKETSFVKSLGAFCKEYENIEFLYTGIKSYQLYDGIETITKHSGLDKEISKNLQFGDILSPDYRKKEDESCFLMLSSEGFIIKKIGGFYEKN